MFCKYCGSQLADNVKFCTKCGKPVENATDSAANRRRDRQKVVVPLAAPGQAQPEKPSRITRPVKGGPDVQPPAGKKNNKPIIALIVVIAILLVVVAVLAFVFWGGFAGGSKNSSSDDTTVEESDDRDDDNEDRGGEEDDREDSDVNDSDGEDKKDEDKDTDHDVASDDADDDVEFGNGSKRDEADADDDDVVVFGGNNADYILPYSSTRRLTSADMEEIADDPWLLRLARNEIYARHNRLFDTKEIREYFESKDWYVGELEDVTDDMLSEIERENIQIIKEYEAALN